MSLPRELTLLLIIHLWLCDNPQPHPTDNPYYSPLRGLIKSAERNVNWIKPRGSLKALAVSKIIFAFDIMIMRLSNLVIHYVAEEQGDESGYYLGATSKGSTQAST